MSIDKKDNQLNNNIDESIDTNDLVEESVSGEKMEAENLVEDSISNELDETNVSIDTKKTTSSEKEKNESSKIKIEIKNYLDKNLFDDIKIIEESEVFKDE